MPAFFYHDYLVHFSQLYQSQTRTQKLLCFRFRSRRHHADEQRNADSKRERRLPNVNEHGLDSRQRPHRRRYQGAGDAERPS